MSAHIVLNGTYRPIETGECTLELRDQVMVGIGEYADSGEPDILVVVPHAVDEDGTDIRPEVARRVAIALRDDFEKPVVAEETMANGREFIIVGTSGIPREPKIIGHLTPDIDIEPYLASLEKAGYRDVHLVERVSTFRRVDHPFAEANRSTYPVEHAAMAKTTRSVAR